MKFRVGDRVRIKSWKDLKKEFGKDLQGEIPCKAYFTKPMKYLCGREFFINEIDTDGGFERIKKIDAWTITPDMVTLSSRPDELDLNLITDYDLKITVNGKGLGYSILHYCTGEDIKNDELASLWDKAREILTEIEDILENAEEE